MDCAGFDRWLDAGAPDRGAAEARAHEAKCVRCARAHRAALELDALLAAPGAAAPAGFSDAVMRRVAGVERARAAAGGVSLIPAAAGLPWWVRAAAEPGVALALVLAGLLAWRGAALPGLAARAAVWVGAALETTARTAGRAPALHPATTDSLGLVALMVMPWIGWLLFRWTEGLALRAARGT